MAAIAAAVISAALAAGGAIYKNKAEKKAAKKKKKYLQRQIDIQKSVGGLALDQREAATKRAADKRLGGLSTAEKDIGRNLREREGVLQGQVAQSLGRSGLGSTSIGVNAKRATSSDTSRAMSDLLSQLAQARGGIEADREDALGNLALQRGDLASGLAQQQYQGFSDIEDQHRTEGAGEIAFGALGAGLGAYTGAGGNFGGGPSLEQQQFDLMKQIYLNGGSGRGLGGGYGFRHGYGGGFGGYGGFGR